MQALFQEVSYCSPQALFKRFANNPWSLLLESANHTAPFQQTNRYSYICIEPYKTFWLKDHYLLHENQRIDNPFTLLKQYLQQYPQNRIPSLPPFQGGLAGYFSYDINQYIENIPKAALDTLRFPDLALGLYDVVISFDHHLQKAWIISTGYPEFSQQKERAEKRLNAFLALLTEEPPDTTPTNTEKFVTAISANFNQESYVRMVEKAKNYILNGDIFEVNVSQCFQATRQSNTTDWQLYEKITQINPAPFAAFFQLGNRSIVSASPERFISLLDEHIETRPIKGTCPRGTTPDEDLRLSQALQLSEKDRAENIMIVDLMRNDLSRVCLDDSVIVDVLCGLESHASVHHLVSVIKAKLKPEKHALDVLEATLPGGSITGAPKIRAMEIIAELEPNARGPYCGNMGFISFSGDMDTSILIRTYTIADDIITYQAGGAVVLDSVPHQEYQESLEKAKKLSQALLQETEYDYID